jgi:hypothetical protein
MLRTQCTAPNASRPRTVPLGKIVQSSKAHPAHMPSPLLRKRHRNDARPRDVTLHDLFQKMHDLDLGHSIRVPRESSTHVFPHRLTPVPGWGGEPLQ